MRLKSLVGVKAIDFKIDSKALGAFRTAQLVADVEGRIRNTAVLSLTNDAPDATLCVDIDVQAKSGSSIFEVRVFMVQLVTIDRTGDKAVAITWGPMSYLGMDSKIEDAFDTITKNVCDYVDLFLSDYLTANPKRK